MSNPEAADSQSRRAELEEKLRAIDERLRHELVARGFDPAQDDNLALTAPLATLHMERESLRDELASLTDRDSGTQGNRL
jgi:hypothetical protein